LNDPPAANETVKRLLDLSDRYPNDVELFDLGAAFALMFRVRIDERALHDYQQRVERAMAADPKRADSIQLDGWLSIMLGDRDAGRRAIERCTAASPLTNDCRWDEAILAETAGDCETMASVAKKMVATNEGDVRGQIWLVASLAGRGLPYDAQIAKFAEEFPNADSFQAFLRGAEAVYEGRFADSSSQATKLTDKGAASMIAGGVPSRFVGWQWVVEAARESEQPQLARNAVERFFAGLDSATKASNVLADPAPMMWKARVRAGLATTAELESFREGWLKGQRGSVPDSYGWFMAYAALADTPEEARVALANKPKDFSRSIFFRFDHATAVLGRLEWLASNPEAARPLLEEATTSCNAFRFPFLHTRALHALGAILQAEGEKDSACAAFQKVIDRWGKATPRSITADDARKRMAELGCAARLAWWCTCTASRGRAPG
jgi:eukaryotic-like serine/threonine-protein kinase